MENNDEELNEILKSTDALKESIGLNKIVLRLLKENKKESFRLWVVVLVLMLLNIFTIIFFELNQVNMQEKFISEQDKYLEFLQGFDYEIEYVNEEENPKSTIIEQDNNNGNNIVQTGNNSIYNQ